MIAGEPGETFWRRVALAGEALREFGPQRREGPVGKILAQQIPDLVTVDSFAPLVRVRGMEQSCFRFAILDRLEGPPTIGDLLATR